MAGHWGICGSCIACWTWRLESEKELEAVERPKGSSNVRMDGEVGP